MVRLEIALGIGFATRKSWTWKRRVDRASIDLIASGEADYAINKWFGQESCKAKNTFHAIDIVKLKYLFLIVAASILIVSVILVIEMYWSRILHIVRRPCRQMR